MPFFHHCNEDMWALCIAVVNYLNNHPDANEASCILNALRVAKGKMSLNCKPHPSGYQYTPTQALTCLLACILDEVNSFSNLLKGKYSDVQSRWLTEMNEVNKGCASKCLFSYGEGNYDLQLEQSDWDAQLVLRYKEVRKFLRWKPTGDRLHALYSQKAVNVSTTKKRKHNDSNNDVSKQDVMSSMSSTRHAKAIKKDVIVIE